VNPGLSSLGAPPDALAWAALGLALLAAAIAIAPPRLRAAVTARFMRHPRLTCGVLAGAALVLSALWTQFYLRGGPRIIDATSYLLQAKGLASGRFVWQPPGELASHLGRFLVSPTDEALLGVIFPPGYPALLALGVFFGSPMAIGPLLAAALCLATYHLARALFDDTKVALLAAALSVVCAALRYHTADTMAHGASALWLTVALCGATRGGRGLWIAGLACGAAWATRPVTGMVVTAVIVVCVLRSSAKVAGLRAMALGLVPGAALLVWHQRATTGQWLASSQQRYYALSDNPPVCFRYGFGEGIGCRFEHGDFVSAHLQHGYGLVEALGTTGRRLLWHALDVGNAEPLAYLALSSVFLLWRHRGVRLIAAVIGGVILAYAPFYFDGSYPGGGARMFADVLPLEHALIAFAATRLELGRFVLPVALIGFALRASYGHAALAAREGGHPMYEPSVVAAAGVTRGLVFVDTDHGYNLGFDPRVRAATDGIVVARLRGDRFDLQTWEALGKPLAYRYHFDLSGQRPPSLQAWSPPADAAPRYEAESLWPAWDVHAGSVQPTHTAACGSPGRGLRLIPDASGVAKIVLRLPTRGAEGVRAWWIGASDAPSRARMSLAGRPAPDTDVISNICAKSPSLSLTAVGPETLLEVEARGGPVVLDAFELVASPKGVDN
jgi:hypothetical protein